MRRPFEGEEFVTVVLPDVEATPEPERTELAGITALLDAEPLELEAELGAPVVLTTHDPGTGARFLLNSEGNGPLLRFSWEERVLRGAGANAASLRSTFNALRTLSITEGDMLVEEECGSWAEVVDRIVQEVGHTYPAFGLRRLDWDALCAHHRPRILRASEPLPSLQEWPPNCRTCTRSWLSRTFGEPGEMMGRYLML